MKKKITITITLIFVLSIIICIVSIKKEKDESLKNISINDQNLTFIFETDKGNITGSSDDWLSDEYKDYVLDEENSRCNGDSASSLLSWDAENHRVILPSKESSKCTLYFRLGSKSLSDTIKDLVGDGNEVVSGEGYLYHHDSSLENGANDGGYRYAGDKPNNYICFGAGSEAYNSGQENECPLTNKYRIIGLVPVETKSNGTQTLVKIIKAEYITAEELGISSPGTDTSGSYTSLKRIEGSATSVPAFHWNDTENNTWGTSTLYQALNNDTSGYLSFLYGKDETKRQNWANKVETVKWNVGGWITYSVTPKAMYDGEMTNNGSTGAGTTVDAKVGLMYAHDYGFASKKDNWTTKLYNYSNDNNRQANWLFNGVYEWTISRHWSPSNNAFYVDITGYVNVYNVYYNSFGVRPVLYLTSDVKLGGGEGIDGSQSKPYKVS